MSTFSSGRAYWDRIAADSSLDCSNLGCNMECMDVRVPYETSVRVEIVSGEDAETVTTPADVVADGLATGVPMS